MKAMLTCSLTTLNTLLHKNTRNREAALYLAHHHSFLADIHLQLENSYTDARFFSQALHAIGILPLGFFLICCLINLHYGDCNCPDICYILMECP